MQTFYTPLRTGRIYSVFLLLLMALGVGRMQAQTAQTLPFTQNWNTTTLITTNNDWTGVAGIIGYRGDNLTALIGDDPQTIIADGSATPVNVTANAVGPNATGSGGIYEFDTLSNPVVAMQGSGTADAPFIQIAVNTTGASTIAVAYTLRDIDGSTDNAVQAVALQYRVGSTGNFTNLPAGFVADASTGPNLATLVTPVSVTLPAACDNQPLVYVRIITANATGNDELIGIDDISITAGTVSSTPSVALSVSASSGTEAGATVVTVTATASAAVTNNETVSLAVTGNGITAGDYTLTNTTITIPAGSTTGTVTFTIVDDTDLEGNETAVLTISNPSSGILLGTATQNIAITDNDVTLVITEVHPSGSASTTYAADWFEITNTGTTPVDITGWKMDDNSNNYSTAVPMAGVTSIAPGQSVIFMEGTGANNAAFTSAWFGATIPAGFAIGSYTGSGIGLSGSGDGVNLFNTFGNFITGVTFGIATNGVTFDNKDGLTTLTLLSAAGVNGAFVSATGNEIGSPGTILTIPTVTLSVSVNTGTEAGATVITVTATANPPVTNAQTVDLLVSGTGITAADYTLGSSTLSLPASGTTATTTFTIVDDAAIEGTETAVLTLSNPSAGMQLGGVIAQNIAITDNDFPPSGLIMVQSGGNTNVMEGGATDSFTIVLTAQPTADVNVALGTGTQVTVNPASLTFTTATWNTPQTVAVSAVDDATVEGAHTESIGFAVSSADASYNGLTIASLAVNITDNDAPVVALSVSSQTATEAGATVITVYATTSGPVTGNQAIPLSIGGTGITSADYYITGTTITLPNGQSSGSVKIIIADDATQEPAETMTVTITSVPAGISLGTATASIAIANNDCSFMHKIGGITSTNGAEIPAFDPATDHLFVVAGTVIEEYSISSTGTLALIGTLTPGFTPATGINAVPNSVTVKNGVVAAAWAMVNATTAAQQPGVVSFYQSSTGTFIDSVHVGYLPDMITYTPDGTKVMTANEGEPNSYGQPASFDPEGSVSIIDLSAGVANATVQHATFTSYNSQMASLKAAGVRIYGPGATVAQDIEPEYIAFAPDGQTAMVTLQENNALAVVDIATATVTSIVPLGLKDHNTVTVSNLDTYTFTGLPVLGNTAAGQAITLGGFSGLFFEGYAANGNLKFVTHTDRGPNGEPVGAIRPFMLPNFAPEVIRFELDPATGQLTLTQRIQLKKNGTTLLTGLPNTALSGGTASSAYNDETPVDLFNNVLPLDPMGADLEGITVAADGSFWMVDEYRPAIYHFDPTGLMLNRFVPAGTAAAAGQPAGTYGTESLPAVLAQRRQNRGFEAVAFKDGKLYAFVQSPLRNPVSLSNTALNGMNNTRVVEFDVTTQTTTAQYLYRMDNGNLGTVNNTRPDKIGDAAYMGNGEFLVVERDDDALPNGAPLANIEKKIYRFSLDGATNVNGNDTLIDLGGGVFKTIDQMSEAELATRNIKALRKVLHVDLALAGYNTVEKVEGLTLVDRNTIAVINDNDFQVAGAVINNTTGTFTPDPTPEPVVLGLISTISNGFDASDRDVDGTSGAGGKINIRNWPVYGMYQPDAIASYTVGGQTYYITANEGDTRAWTGFSEEIRVGASGYVLDPTAFPNAASLKLSQNLGRLQLTNATGDTDGDGDVDQIHANGARSFTIWNSAGAKVYDSGDQLEQITAGRTPTLFNAEGASATFDTRSDNKGPEPEGVAIGTINSRTYAFIGMERVGDIMVFDVTDPVSPEFIQYLNAPEDVSPEGLTFVSAENSPTGKPLVISAQEVSLTVAVYEVQMPFLLTHETSGLKTNDGILCPGATATLFASPGTAYLWNDGTTADSLVVNAPGTYSVNITANGCTRAAEAAILYTDTLVIQALADSALACFGDSTSATVTVLSGVGPYTYQWSTSAAAPLAENLTAGTYTATVTDANTCTTSTSLLLTEPALLTAVVDSTLDVSCFGLNNGAISLTITGGTMPYTQLWSNGDLSEDPDSLAPGTYTSIITDANGCATADTAVITEPSLLMAAVDSVHDATCFGLNNGTIALTVSGGTMPYAYLWSNGDLSEDPDSLTAGTYTGTITDANGCTLADTVVITEPAALVLATDSIQRPACFGQTNGSIFISVNGGTAPYTYAWSNSSTSEDPIGIGAGTYIATATDANGCQIMDTVSVTQPAALTAGVTKVANACKEGSTGSITVAPAGGTPAYQVTWNTGATGNTLGGLAAGHYTATLTDANGCTTPVQATVVNVDSLPVANGSGTITGSGEVTFSNSSSANTLSTQWNFGDGTTSGVATPVHTYALNGDYTVTLIVSNFCGKDTLTFPVKIQNVGIAEDLSGRVALYPNPAENAFSLAFDGVTLSGAGLELYSADGKQVVYELLGTVSGQEVRTIALDRSVVPAGVYTVRIVSAEGVMVKRIIVR